MKRIVTMQDISCVGKCSLTTALPVISAMGVEAAVMPTAVLSTHTAFSSFTFHDLTGEIQKIMDVWKKENIIFCVKCHIVDKFFAIFFSDHLSLFLEFITSKFKEEQT